MASQVAAKCFMEQDTGSLVDEAGIELQAKSLVMCQMTPFVIRQLTGIPPTSITLQSTPVSDLEVVTVGIPHGLSEAEWMEFTPGQLVPVLIVDAYMQPSIANQYGGSYIMEAQVMQVENGSCHTSLSSLDSVAHEYLKNHFNELLNNKVYNTFKELFANVNIDSMKEPLPEGSIYNDIIAQFVEEINSKYGMTLTLRYLEPCEVGLWAETVQVASGSKEGPSLQEHRGYMRSP